MARLFEIYMGPASLGAARYPRPLLVVAAGTLHAPAAVLPLSTQVDTYYDSNVDFLIEMTASDFKATGLKARSFIQCRILLELPAGAKRIGELQGALLKDFRAHYGI